MSAKRKGKRAKEKAKLKTARRTAAKPTPLSSRESQRDIEAKKQLTVPKEHGQREAVNKIPDVEIPPPVLPFDQLEQIAAREKPEVAGAWWVALQAAHHVIESAAERDMHTGESLPRPLSEVLKAVADATKTGTRPIPNDRLHRAAVLAFEPLRTILDHPRTRLLREHAPRPIHTIREMDTHSMAWLARLPGRTIREKLAGKQHALSVVRRFTPDTPENRVVKRVADLLVRRLDGRFAHAVAYDEDSPCDTQQREALDFCRRFFRDEEFGLIPPSDMPRPNNALLSDRLYSRVWRTWMLLHGEEDALRAAWPHVEECFRTAAFWAIAGEIADRYDARVVEELAVPNAEMADSHKCCIQNNTSTAIGEIELLVMADDASRSDLEAEVISVQQVHGEIRIAEKRLRSQKNPTKGHVKLIIDDIDGGNKRFGFIRGESEEEYYFNPGTVGDDDTFSSLRKGDSVTFTAGSQGEGNRVRALNVRPTGLRVAHVIEKGSKIWRVKFDDGGSGQPEFQRFRGFPVHATDNEQGATTKHSNAPSALKDIFTTAWRGWADIEGLRDLANSATPSLDLKLPSASDTSSEKIDSKGIDPFGRSVFAGTKEKVRSTTTLPYALCHQSQWQVGTSRRLPHVGKLWPLDAYLSDAADESTAITSYHQIVRALAKEVHAQDVSFVVPDGPDEFSQQTLRAAMLGAFPRSRPVARSVAAALAWQHQSEFPNRGVKDGDAVLVLCAEADVLRFSLLVARRDLRLAEERPESKGIFWERRPALPADEYGEGLGLRDIWRDYARRLFKVRDRDERYRDELISYIVDSGLLQEAVESGSPRWIRDRDRWLVLEHSPQDWDDVLGRWRKRFNAALKSGLGELISKAVSGQKRCHFLFVGPPFNDWTIFSHVKNALSQTVLLGNRRPSPCPQKTHISLEHVDYIASEKGALAVGAAEFTERACAGLPAWKDWLPDLFLEIIRGGLYDEVEIMRDKVVDATLGEVHREKVAEELVLPAGQAHYILPLVAGRANRRPVSSDLRLNSAHFPLQQDVRVRLELSYQYGVEQEYEITVIPVEPATAPFSELKGKWVRAGKAEEGSTTKLVPPFRRPVSRDVNGYESTTIAGIKREVERLLSGGAKNPKGTIGWLNLQLRDQREKLEQAAFRERNWGAIPTYAHSDLLKDVEILLKNTDNLSIPGVSPDNVKELKKELKNECSLFRWALGEQVPETITTRIRTKLDSDEPHLVPEHYANAAGILHRTAQRDDWLDFLWKKVVKRIEPYDNPQLYRETIHEIAHTAWVHSDFLEEFAERNPDFVQTSLRAIERGVRNVVSKAAQAIEPDSETKIYRGHVRSFQACCELVLALLRLRDTPLGAPLVANPSRMSQLTKSIRRADCLLTRAEKEVRTSLDFGLNKPEALAQVSDLAYYANYYLLGDETMNLARID